MTYLIIVLAMLAIFVIIFTAHRLAKKDKALRQTHRQAKQFTIRADDTWDVADKLTEYIDAPDIIDILMDYFTNLIQRREQLLPLDDTQQLLQDAQSFKGEVRSRKAKSELSGDQDINSAKRIVTKTNKLLKAAFKQKLLTGQSYANMHRTLRMRILRLEVECHEKIGISAAQKDEPAVANVHFKYAKKLLIESDLKFDGKVDWIRKISEHNQSMFGKNTQNKLNQGLQKESDEENFNMSLKTGDH